MSLPDYFLPWFAHTMHSLLAPTRTHTHTHACRFRRVPGKGKRDFRIEGMLPDHKFDVTSSGTGARCGSKQTATSGWLSAMLDCALCMSIGNIVRECR